MFDFHDKLTVMFYRMLHGTGADTTARILAYLATKPLRADIDVAMCHFQDAVNSASDDKFACRMVVDWMVVNRL